MKFVCLLVFFFSLFPCNSQSVKLNADNFEKGITTDSIQILDVRTGGEFNSGHIKNAMWIDWNDKKQFNERIQYVDKNRPVYIYCLVGGRSTAAADWMRINGFTRVLELEGGINAWKKSGKPVEGNNSEKQMTSEEYWSLIPKDRTVLVDIGATWCPPCVKMAPVIQSIQKDSSLHFKLLKIDAGVHTELLRTLNIDPIPVFIIYKNGKEIWRKEGVVTREELIHEL